MAENKKHQKETCKCGDNSQCHDKKNNEVTNKDLNKKIKDLEEQLQKEHQKYEQLLSKYQHDQQDFVTKISQKANEANKLIEEKIKTLQERSNKDIQNIKKYAIEPYATSLIDIINQFENAINYEVKDEKVKNYQNGFKLFLTMFKNCLSEMNVTKIEVKVGDEFDGQTMECLDTIEANGIKTNHVAQVINTGYRLHDRIIKPTLVKIAK